MRRFLGAIPLLAYLFATLALVGLGVIFLAFVDSVAPDDALGELFFDLTINLGANIFVFVLFMLACIPLLMFIFKLIHLISGARFCGIFCVLIDVLVTVALFVAAFSDPVGGGDIAVIAAAELGCCVCNMISVAR